VAPTTSRLRAIRAGTPIWRAGERFPRQRDRRGRVTGEHVTGHGDIEKDGSVGEVAASPRDARGLFGEAGGVGERADSHRDVLARGADGLLDPPVRRIAARIGLGRPAAQLLGAGHVSVDGSEQCADRQG
jgi:hypothetical protein